MSETEFSSIPPDAVIDFVRMHPEIFLVYQPLSDHDLCAKLLVDAITSGAGRILVEQGGSWWFIGAEKDWIRGNSAGKSIDDLFCQITPNPRAGQNAMRNEMLLTAYAEDVALFDSRGQIERLDSFPSTQRPLPLLSPRMQGLCGVCFSLEKPA